MLAVTLLLIFAGALFLLGSRCFGGLFNRGRSGLSHGCGLGLFCRSFCSGLGGLLTGGTLLLGRCGGGGSSSGGGGCAGISNSRGGGSLLARCALAGSGLHLSFGLDVFFGGHVYGMVFSV